VITHAYTTALGLCTDTCKCSLVCGGRAKSELPSLWRETGTVDTLNIHPVDSEIVLYISAARCWYYPYLRLWWPVRAGRPHTSGILNGTGAQGFSRCLSPHMVRCPRVNPGEPCQQARPPAADHAQAYLCPPYYSVPTLTAGTVAAGYIFTCLCSMP
jgi:hypothetical protein